MAQQQFKKDLDPTRYGVRVIATLCGGDEEKTLALTQNELERLALAKQERHMASLGMLPDNPDLPKELDRFIIRSEVPFSSASLSALHLPEADRPQRPKVQAKQMGPEEYQYSALMDAHVWYSATALLSMYEQRGKLSQQDREEVFSVTKLTTHRPFFYIFETLITIFKNPKELSLSDLTDFDKAISISEELVTKLMGNKLYKLFIDEPPTPHELGVELRKLGAPYDYELYTLAAKAAAIGDKTLIPGAGFLYGLRESKDFVFDATQIDGRYHCLGMRRFRELASDCIQKIDPELKYLFGYVAKKAFLEYASPLLSEASGKVHIDDEITGHLISLRDGLLKLINRKLEAFSTAIRQIEPSSNTGNLIAMVASSDEEKITFLTSRSVELSMVSQKREYGVALREILSQTPQDKRIECFDLFLSAPSLLESYIVLRAMGKSFSSIMQNISILVAPMPSGSQNESMAQVIKRLSENKQRGVVGILFEHGAWIKNFLHQAPQNSAVHDLVLALEMIGRPAPFFTAFKEAVDSGDMAGAAALIEKEFGSTKNSVVSTETAPPHTELSPLTIIETPPTPPRGALPSWCKWVVEDSSLSLRAQEMFYADVEKYGATSWYKKMIFTPQLFEQYRAHLVYEDRLGVEKCIADARPSLQQAEPLISNSPDKRFSFKKVLICGGSGGTEKEAGFRKLFPLDVDVHFYYSEHGGKTFANISPTGLSPSTLVVWMTDQTSHAECWRIWDMAESCFATFLLMRKGLQNPQLIVNEIESRVGSMKQEQ